MATPYVEIPTPQQSAAPTCRCPACRGLECLERPRFFAGQLLTEAELNSEQAYMLAKNRMHNRYLHGWGVVSGLEVTCHSCDGWVRVNPGYALDPCGNDVIVCRDVQLNVLDAIRKCQDARKPSDDDCSPWRDPNDNCVDTDEHWCIALEYRENETRGVMPLQQKTKSPCGCGGGCGETTSKEARPKTPTPSARTAACEATRIVEQFRLSVIPEPASCTRARTTEQVLARVAGPTPAFAPGTILAAFLPETFRMNAFVQALIAAAPAASLLGRVLTIAETLETFFAARFNRDERTILIENARICLADRSPQGGTQADVLRLSDLRFGNFMTVDLCCRFRRAVRDLFLQNPFNVRCEPFRCEPCEQPASGTTVPITSIPVPVPVPVPVSVATTSSLAREGIFEPGRPSTTNNDNNNNSQLMKSFCCLVDALVNHIVDAVCSALLPPAPPDPCENRLIIACVTVSDTRVVRICNHSCRRYAGSFPTLEHWTSAVPIVPLFRQLLREICCAPNAAPVLAEVMTTIRGWKPRDPGPIVDPGPGPGPGPIPNPIPDQPPQA